jgi:hypothetical protein
MQPRVTICTLADGTFEILINEAGRDLLVKELQGLDRRRDHFHLDFYDDADIADATDVMLSPVPYRTGDTVLHHGKVLFRPDDWDREYFPHVLSGRTNSE